MITPVENILLTRPFHISEVSFKPGGGGNLFAHADPRAYWARLNEIFPSEWQTTTNLYVLTDRVVVETTLKIRGIERSDIGEETLARQTRNGPGGINDNAATTAKAQSFKRACATFGLGEYFYHFSNLRGEDAARRLVAGTTDYRFWDSLEQKGVPLVKAAELLAEGKSFKEVHDTLTNE